MTIEELERSMQHKEELVEKMGRRAGLEHPFTVTLARLAERDHTWDADFDKAYESLMNYLNTHMDEDE